MDCISLGTCPPSPPPPFTEHVDWMQMAYVLGSLYASVMLLVVVSYLCSSRTTTTPSDDLTSAMIEPVADDSEQRLTRTAKRGRSAMQMSGPGIDLSQIERSIKMGFLRKVYSILATQMLVTVGIVVGFI